MAGKALSYDSEVEYVESNGTQFINTHLYASPAMRVAMNINFTAINTNGALFRSGTNFWYGIYINSNYFFAYTFKDNSGTFLSTGKPAVANHIYTVDFDGPTRTLKIDNVTYPIQGSPATLTSDHELPLLARITGSGVFSPSCSAKLYNCKIFIDGSIVRDYITVRVGTVGYMYDRVSGQLFGNAGTGDFILGPDVQ